MSPLRIAGIIMLIFGIGLLIVGLNASDSISDRMSNFFTGHYTDATVWYMLGGAAVALGGLLLLVFGGRTGRA